MADELTAEQREHVAAEEARMNQHAGAEHRLGRSVGHGRTLGDTLHPEPEGVIVHDPTAHREHQRSTADPAIGAVVGRKFHKDEHGEWHELPGS